MRTLVGLFVFCIYLVAAAAEAQTTWHVNGDNCPGPGSGTESDPFCRIQDCLDAAVDGDECVVARGTYFENINLLGKAVTLRSADGPDVTTIDANDSGTVVECTSGEGPDTVLNGFTITHGNAARGGGMHIVNSSPTLTNCMFSENSANRGGGMFNDGAAPTVDNCTFSGNLGGARGGGMYNDGGSPTVTNCAFSGSSATNGGGMYNVDSSSTVTDCTFSDNTATYGGGGMYNVGGSPTVNNCTFSGSSATNGGGMYNLSSSPMVTNCSFDWNAATDGGGMYCTGSCPTVNDCTFSMNTAENGGGMANEWDSDPTVTNCVFEGNIAGEHGGGMINSFESTPVILGCLLKENSAALCGGGIRNFANFEDRPKVIGCRLVGNMAQHGGGMCNEHSRLWAIDTNFIENTARQGGGGGMFSQSSNLFVANCIFRGNAATDTESTAQDGEVSGHSARLAVPDRSRRAMAVTSGWGGGMINFSGTLVMTGSLFSDNSAKHGGGMFDSTPLSIFTNSTFFGNSATNLGGGIVVDSGGSSLVSNCIVWNNTAAEGAEFYHTGSGLLTIRYSTVAGGQGGVQGPGALLWEEGNIAADPMFLDPADGNYRLLKNSPCIDSADNTVLPSDPVDLDGDGDTKEPTPHDLDGNPRFVDDPNTDDTGVGDPPIVDMGSYEFRDPCADDDGDGRVTICHLPPGNLSNAHTIIISIRALPAHLAHGDHCGPCDDGDG